MQQAIAAAVDKLQADFSPICMQMFVMGPQSFKDILSEDDIPVCAELIAKHSIAMFVHGSYLDHIFTSGIAKGVVHFVKRELKTCVNLGARGLVVHMAPSAMKNLNNLRKYDLPMLQNTTLWLEINSAKPSADSFETPAKLQALFNGISDLNLQYLRCGLVIDTAHLYACGVAFTTYEQASTWLNKLRKLLPDLPIAIHLNDNDTELGSGRDVHAKLTLGNIWSDYNLTNGTLDISKSGLVAVLDFATMYNIPVILERRASDVAADLKLLRKLNFCTLDQ